jgi:hypothetical protein
VTRGCPDSTNSARTLPGASVVTQAVTLSDLAFACHVYAGMSDYDASYLHFMKATSGAPDLGNPAHRRALLAWLNKWGCRQFDARQHERASSEMLEWSNQYVSSLFPVESQLRDLSQAQVAAVAIAYQSLSSKIASYKTRNRSTYAVSVGPTGASKVLFAIRPHALPPWDSKIREHFGHDGSGASYRGFLGQVRSVLENVAKLCESEDFTLEELPARLGRPHSTLPKVIDEYHWVTITKGCKPPDRLTLRRWTDWSR